MNARKKTNLRLAFWGLLLSLVLFVFPGQGLSDVINVRVNISPFKIILNADGNSEDIQARIPMVLPAGGSITEFDAALWFNSETEEILAEGFYYCAIDDILHVYFDRTDVLDYLRGNKEIEDKVVANVWVGFFNGYDYVELSGFDVVEVIDPDHRNQPQ